MNSVLVARSYDGKEGRSRRRIGCTLNYSQDATKKDSVPFAKEQSSTECKMAAVSSHLYKF